jgi:hypothetical protein
MPAYSLRVLLSEFRHLALLTRIQLLSCLAITMGKDGELFL